MQSQSMQAVLYLLYCFWQHLRLSPQLASWRAARLAWPVQSGTVKRRCRGRILTVLEQRCQIPCRNRVNGPSSLLKRKRISWSQKSKSRATAPKCGRGARQQDGAARRPGMSDDSEDPSHPPRKLRSASCAHSSSDSSPTLVPIIRNRWTRRRASASSAIGTLYTRLGSASRFPTALQ